MTAGFECTMRQRKDWRTRVSPKPTRRQSVLPPAVALDATFRVPGSVIGCAMAVGSFDEFVRAHVGDLVRMAYVITWDEFEAEDLVQESLLRISKRWSTVGGMELPLAYARRVVANLAFDGRGRRSRRRDELASSRLPAVADERAGLELAAIGSRSELADVLGRLTRQQRTVLGLRYFLDLSEAEVAAVLGCSVGNVKSTASRALASCGRWPRSAHQIRRCVTSDRSV